MSQHTVFRNPKHTAQVADGRISFGLSSFGYDVRCGHRFKVFTNAHCGVVDPKHFDPRAFVDVDLTPDGHLWQGMPGDLRSCFFCGDMARAEDIDPAELCPKSKPDHVLIPPNSFALAETLEEVAVPRDCLAIVIGKSTYARCGIILPMTPLEPEWRGKVTLEIGNTTPLPAKVYAGEGIGQVIFLRSDDGAACRVSYADRKGRYQNQTGLTLPFVR